MSRSRRAGIVLVIAVAALAVAPIDALAQRMGGGARSGGQGGGSHGGSHRGGSHHGGPGGRSFAHRRFGGGFVVFAPPFWYGSDFSYDPGSAYATRRRPTARPSIPEWGARSGARSGRDAGARAVGSVDAERDRVSDRPLGATWRRPHDSVSLGVDSEPAERAAVANPAER